MQTTEGSGCRSREKRRGRRESPRHAGISRPGNARSRDHGRWAVQVAHSEDQSKSGISTSAAVRKAHRRANILPRLIKIPRAAGCRGAKGILGRARYSIFRTAEIPVGRSAPDRLAPNER
jgi:hypothetical protein